ncbi:hormogonium polysaccharide biosynthesis acetyltransferase HpsU [Spirulina sp. 06S082]|uniref:hormogonium polysaccharide biosynthesis acetyltransferase HpsU n=1 Tax=Spirulina sp. 06S082 TaxID=3110248 RepID=UPI002B216A16|nr:hormogonium polysaccharide biosynthesis acetyltransferase HpsU [Spirulina sp. 06S082]MEA5469132.1 hormogonium polysaccharide biosynthesis acetyltransferase HpsU [Spirulina sp. 06S082]
MKQTDLSSPLLDTEPWIDLRNYDQSEYDRGRPSWYVLLWWFVQAIAFPVTLHNFSSIRCTILRLFGAKIGKGVIIRPTARITYPWKIEIGDYTWIGDDVVLYSLDRIQIGEHCVISQKCYLCTGSHDISDRAFALQTEPIFIGNGAWVATDCFIAPGVKIGANAVIGGRSSVYRDIPAAQVAFGNPCRPRYERKIVDS